MGESIGSESVDSSGTSGNCLGTKTQGLLGGVSADFGGTVTQAAVCWGVTVGQMKGDFPALTAAQLGGSAAVWSVIVRHEGGWELWRRGRRRRRRVGGWLQ